MRKLLIVTLFISFSHHAMDRESHVPKNTIIELAAEREKDEIIENKLKDLAKNPNLSKGDQLLQAYFGKDHEVNFLKPYVNQRIKKHQRKRGMVKQDSPLDVPSSGQQENPLSLPTEKLILASLKDYNKNQEMCKKILFAVSGMLGTVATAFFTVYLNCQSK